MVFDKEKLKRFRDRYVIVYSKFNRGKSQIAIFVSLFNTSVMAGLGIDLWNKHRDMVFFGQKLSLPYLSAEIIPIMVVSFILVSYLWGHLDQSVLKITQAEKDYQGTKLNPYMMKIGKIEKMLEEITKNEIHGNHN